MTDRIVRVTYGQRDAMPRRFCEGFAGRACSHPNAPLSFYNTEPLCGTCARRRSDAIVAADNARRAAS